MFEIILLNEIIVKVAVLRTFLPSPVIVSLFQKSRRDRNIKDWLTHRLYSLETGIIQVRQAETADTKPSPVCLYTSMPISRSFLMFQPFLLL